MRIKSVMVRDGVRDPGRDAYTVGGQLSREDVGQMTTHMARYFFEETATGIIVVGERRAKAVSDGAWEPGGIVQIPWSNVKSVEYETGKEPPLPKWSVSNAAAPAAPAEEEDLFADTPAVESPANPGEARSPARARRKRREAPAVEASPPEPPVAPTEPASPPEDDLWQ